MSNNTSPRAVILTALRVERQAVYEHLIQSHEETHPEGTIYWHGIFPCQGCEWDVGIVEIGPGNPGAAFETERAINYLKPDVTLFVGVAGGLKDVNIGDVVAATSVYNYETGKANDIFESRVDVGKSTYRMEQRARAEASSKDWLQRLKGAIPVTEPSVYVAPIAAGEKVVSSIHSSTYALLQTHHSGVLAVEMEGYGFLRAAHANQFVNALIIRGISDLIEDKREADAANSQNLASRHASAFAFEVLAKLGRDKEFLASITRIKPKAKTQKTRRPANRYYIRNSGQMAAGDNAHMVNNWYKLPE